jgi:two-component system response regulator VanR
MILEPAGFNVELYSDSKVFLRDLSNSKLKESTIAVLLLDIRMKVSGERVLRKIKESYPYTKMQIIIYSAELDDENKEYLTNMGALGYFDKMMQPSDLVNMVKARVNYFALLHNGVLNKTLVRLENAGITIDENTRKGYINGRQLQLSAVQYDLLFYLIQNAGRYVHNNAINRNLFGRPDRYDSDLFRSNILVIRKKLRDFNKKYSDLLVSRRNTGWMFKV